jgi:ectoine hydroxylase-related dioxygenase (phytanoyl-CoA dioxygenase family)
MSFDVRSDQAPFVDSIFYSELKKYYSHDEYSKIADDLNKDGFAVVDLRLEGNIIDQANIDINNAIKQNNFKRNAETYHYNESPRIVEGWKFSPALKNIATNKKLIDILNFCYQSEPIPMSTINFLKGTEQPLHSDEFHYGTIPHRYLTGVWVALEDINPDSGPLSLVKGSNKLPIFSLEKIGVKSPKNEKEQKEIYTIYEDWVRNAVIANNLEIVTPILKKGECIIWLSNTLHGAFKIKDKSLSRKSVAIHFHYSKCKKIFYPSYSNLEKGRIIERSLEYLDIRKQ